MCAFGRATRRTSLRVSFEGLSIARRCFTTTGQSRARGEGGRSTRTRWAHTLPLFAPHRPSTPIVLLPSQLPVHQGVPTDRNPISQSSTSNGIPELRAHAISGQVPRGRCYNAVLGKGTDKARTRNPPYPHGQPRPGEASPQKMRYAYKYHRFPDWSVLLVRHRGGGLKMKSGRQPSRQEEGAA